MKQRKFNIFCDDILIQSGNVTADTGRDAYRKFLKMIYEKEFGEQKTYRGEPVTDSDIFQSIFK